MTSTNVPGRYERINDFRLTYDDLPDGAFFALAEEQGIGVSDWVWFAKQYEKRESRKRERGK